jgi:predicted regulator of Ras-like GTPase activity (Roadblock/LC7/MglB family)
MDDYSALAQLIAVSVNGVRGSLILSRDGLVLGAYPDGDEGVTRPAWLKFATLGDPDKSFVEFGDQVWAFVKRGAHAAFAVADAGTRPGILVNQMEQVLLTAEDGRARRDTLRLPDASSAPSGKPRTSLHPPADRPQPVEVAAPAAPPSAAEVTGEVPVAPEGSTDPASVLDTHEPPLTASEAPVTAAEETPVPPSPESETDVATALSKEPKKLVSAPVEGVADEEGEVDRVLLAKEFSGLLQMDSGDDEDSS